MRENKDKVNDIPVEEFEIFGAHKSREQIKAEEKARKQAEREAMRRVAEQRRKAAKAGGTASRRDVTTALIALVAVIALAIVGLVVPLSKSGKQEKFLRDESKESYFVDSDATPDMTTGKLDGVPYEVYYTRGGYLCVKMLIGNGGKTDQILDSVNVMIFNADEDQVCGGYAKTENNLLIKAGGVEKYTFYIAPEHLSITDDPLESIAYEIKPVGRDPETK